MTAARTPPGAPRGSWPPHAMDAWVPHRGAMNLLDSVAHCDEQAIEARVRVPADGLFTDAQGMPAWVGIEYMAQAVAAWSGARARVGGGSPRIGYLLGSRRYEAAVPFFEAGAELQVFAQCELMSDNGLGMFECRIERDGRVLAGARLSVFEPPDGSGEGSPQSGPREGQEK
jgi:predicted hotdog family 3-hydroxylacyl-ACP dehydratase